PELKNQQSDQCEHNGTDFQGRSHTLPPRSLPSWWDLRQRAPQFSSGGRALSHKTAERRYPGTPVHEHSPSVYIASRRSGEVFKELFRLSMTVHVAPQATAWSRSSIPRAPPPKTGHPVSYSHSRQVPGVRPGSDNFCPKRIISQSCFSTWRAIIT